MFEKGLILPKLDDNNSFGTWVLGTHNHTIVLSYDATSIYYTLSNLTMNTMDSLLYMIEAKQVK